MQPVMTVDLALIGDYSSEAKNNRNLYYSRGVLVEGVLTGAYSKISGLIFKVQYNIDDAPIDFNEFIDIDEFNKVLSLYKFSNMNFDAIVASVASTYLKDSLEDKQRSIKEYISLMIEHETEVLETVND